MMRWNPVTTTPPLSPEQIAKGDTGGWSIPLIFRHQSGRLSYGTALLHDGKVSLWYPGRLGDSIHVPQAPGDADKILAWAVCPTIEEIVEAFDRQPKSCTCGREPCVCAEDDDAEEYYRTH